MIIVTAAIIRQRGKIFAARRGPDKEMAGCWEFPGGKLEHGETPEACLQRELREELDIEARILTLFAESIHTSPRGSIHLLGYETEIVSGVPRCIDHDRLGWFLPEDLESLAWAPADLPIVKKLSRLKTAGQ